MTRSQVTTHKSQLTSKRMTHPFQRSRFQEDEGGAGTGAAGTGAAGTGGASTGAANKKGLYSQ